MMTLGRRVRELRKARGWTQADLAWRAGLTPGMVSHIEVGRYYPSILSLLKLSRALATPSWELMAALEEEFSDRINAHLEGSQEGCC